MTNEQAVKKLIDILDGQPLDIIWGPDIPLIPKTLKGKKKMSDNYFVKFDDYFIFPTHYSNATIDYWLIKPSDEKELRGRRGYSWDEAMKICQDIIKNNRYLSEIKRRGFRYDSKDGRLEIVPASDIVWNNGKYSCINSYRDIGAITVYDAPSMARSAAL